MAKFSKEEMDEILGTEYPDNPLEGGLFQAYRDQKAKDVADGHTKCGTSDCCQMCNTSKLMKAIDEKTYKQR